MIDFFVCKNALVCLRAFPFGINVKAFEKFMIQLYNSEWFDSNFYERILNEKTSWGHEAT